MSDSFSRSILEQCKQLFNKHLGVRLLCAEGSESGQDVKRNKVASYADKRRAKTDVLAGGREDQ